VAALALTQPSTPGNAIQALLPSGNSWVLLPAPELAQRMPPLTPLQQVVQVWSPRNLPRGQDSASAKHAGNPGASPRLVQCSSRPEFGTGAVVLGRASPSQPLREY